MKHKLLTLIIFSLILLPIASAIPITTEVNLAYNNGTLTATNSNTTQLFNITDGWQSTFTYSINYTLLETDYNITCGEAFTNTQSDVIKRSVEEVLGSLDAKNEDIKKLNEEVNACNLAELTIKNDLKLSDQSLSTCRTKTTELTADNKTYFYIFIITLGSCAIIPVMYHYRKGKAVDGTMMRRP